MADEVEGDQTRPDLDAASNFESDAGCGHGRPFGLGPKQAGKYSPAWHHYIAQHCIACRPTRPPWTT